MFSDNSTSSCSDQSLSDQSSIFSQSKCFYFSSVRTFVKTFISTRLHHILSITPQINILFSIYKKLPVHLKLEGIQLIELLMFDNPHNKVVQIQMSIRLSVRHKNLSGIMKNIKLLLTLSISSTFCHLIIEYEYEDIKLLMLRSWKRENTWVILWKWQIMTLSY